MSYNAGPYPVQPEVIQGVAIGYKNRALIADQVLPRVPVATGDFKYLKQVAGEHFTIPDTKIGRKGQANQVEMTGILVPASVVDYGLEDVVPVTDIKAQAPLGIDPVAQATEFVTKLVRLDREQRTAAAVFNPANHVNKATLSGTSQWSDFANSNPISAIMTALDSLLIRPNVLVLGRAVASALYQHPAIVKAFYGTGNDKGVANAQILKELFELEEVLVGESFLNTAKRGQAVSLSRIWGKHAAFIYREKPTSTEAASCFGFTAEYGDVQTSARFDESKGKEGAYIPKVAESVAEIVSASDMSYFFQNAVA